MSDTLTTLNWLSDQRRYMAEWPLASQSVTFLRELYTHDLNADGIALSARLIKAIIATTTELEPAGVAPLAQRVIYGLVRRALWYTLLALGHAQAAGDDEPILTESALAALIAIETQDPIIATPTGRQASLSAVFAGLSWRASTIDLGVDARGAGTATGI